MITNERQYRITMNEIRKFEQAIEALSAGEVNASESFDLARTIQLEAMQSQLDDLRADVSYYDDLKSGKTTLIRAESFGQLPRALISARIAAGLTQAELAQRLGIHEQQVQRYEATNYSSASIQRVGEVIKALNLAVREEFVLPGHGHSS